MAEASRVNSVPGVKIVPKQLPEYGEREKPGHKREFSVSKGFD